MPTRELMITFVGLGFLFIVLARPLMQRRVKPNKLYGFRDRKTLSDETIWYEANAYGGRRLFRTGVATVIAAPLLFCIPSIRMQELLYVFSCEAIFVGGAIWATIATSRYTRRL